MLGGVKLRYRASLDALTQPKADRDQDWRPGSCRCLAHPIEQVFAKLKTRLRKAAEIHQTKAPPAEPTAPFANLPPRTA